MLLQWPHDSYVVNITGGTKLMSLAAYNIFSNKNNCEIFYQPINQPLQRIYPKYEEYEITELLTLDEYIKSQGIVYKYNNACEKNYDFNKDVYRNVIEPNRDAIKDMVAMQNNSYFRNIFKRKDTINFEEIPEEKFVTPEGNKIDKLTVLNVVKAFEFDVKAFTKSNLRYITGGWFEEYVYQKVKNENNIIDENIALNVQINKGNDHNELDVAYIKNNQLHVIECKSFLDGKEGDKILNDALYKLNAIMKSKFGIDAVSYLYTQSFINKESALNRASEFGIKIIDGNRL